MAWKDLADILDAAPPKVLPIHGKEVEFPGRISAWAGLTLLAIKSKADGSEGSAQEVAEQLDISNEDAERLEAELLGSARAELDELGVVGEARNHVAQTLMIWHLSGEEAAEAAWSQMGKAPAQNRAARRAKAGKSSTKSGKGASRSKTGGTGSSGAGGA